MHPFNFYNLFPPFPRDNRVFVAMSFDKKFDNRWEKVIRPAVKAVPVDGSSGNVMLEPYRVDLRKVGDSVFTDIINGIGNCRLFFADVTALEYFDILGNQVSHRNENVLYEVGIAHSRRLPEEVILFRSDNYRLAFDLANMRVNHYEPDKNPEEAKRFVEGELLSAIREIDLRKHLSVQEAVDSLTLDCRRLILEYGVGGETELEYPYGGRNETASIIEMCNSHRLFLELGILSANYLKPGSDLLAVDGKRQPDYNITPFGKVVMEVVLNKLGYEKKR